jgi:hypothetical protein
MRKSRHPAIPGFTGGNPHFHHVCLIRADHEFFSGGTCDDGGERSHAGPRIA